MTGSAFLDAVEERIRGRKLPIVLADGEAALAVEAAGRLRDEGAVQPILLGSNGAVAKAACLRGVELEGLEIVDPQSSPELEVLAARYYELRRERGLTWEEARRKAASPAYFGALLVASGRAAGMVAGLTSATKPFLPAFEIVGLRDGTRRASSVFIMQWPERVFFYADCSLNIEPDAETLAEIGLATAATARAFGYEPRVAFLSFSTRRSARHPSIEKVREAVRLARDAAGDLVCDGEIQFDAALIPAIAAGKAPDSAFALAPANVFIFPDLNSGNIAYKITERLGGARATGPLLQGLKQPINDVSRGCSARDIADVAMLTAAMAAEGRRS